MKMSYLDLSKKFILGCIRCSWQYTIKLYFFGDCMLAKFSNNNVLVKQNCLK